MYLAAELKAILYSYIKEENLTHSGDQKFIRLDELLTESLLKKGEILDVLSKDEALQRLKNACHEHYEMIKPGQEGVVKKGTPPLVKIMVKNVGKRQVTLVSGYEKWDLFTGAEMAEDLRHRAASSTAVQPITGSSPKKPLFEIMVQGTQEIYRSG
jgi:translation initiation factor 2D